MKFILMMHGKSADWGQYSRWSKEDLQRNIEHMRELGRELHEEGVLVDTEGLAWAQEAKLVHAGSDGEPVTDGIFPESKEFLAEYWIVDVEGPELAYKIAARASAAPGPGGEPANMPIEVRRVLSSHGDPGI